MFFNDTKHPNLDLEKGTFIYKKSFPHQAVVSLAKKDLREQMDIHYFNHALFPGTAANKVARINMANAFAKNKKVKKVHFYFVANDTKSVSELNKNFENNVILHPIIIKHYKDSLEDTKNTQKLNKISAVKLYLKFLQLILKKRFNPDDLVYIRGDAPTIAAVLKSKKNKKFKFMFELHNNEFNPPYSIKDRFYLKAFKKATKIITISQWTKNSWIKSKLDAKKIEVLPSGVDLESFDKTKISKSNLRKKLSLPDDKVLIGYIGSLQKNRGIEDILYCASKNNSLIYLIIGGTNSDIAYYEQFLKKKYKKLSNVLFLGNKNNKLIPQYIKSMDLLLAPYSRNCSTYNHMSPVKIFEYAASKVPIIATDAPRIREVFTINDMTFFKADNSKDLNQKIKYVLKHKSESKEKALNAYKKVKQYSWKNRANKILEWSEKNA